MPPAALANYMMIYDAPTGLYTKNATVMDMLCANVCVTSMICLSLEQSYRGHRAVDGYVHGDEHRMAARGNATSFPLPWQDLLKQLSDGAAMEELRRSVSSPRTGQGLTHVVSMLLKASAQDDSDVDMARFIRQAMVQRSYVVKLLETMKNEAAEQIKHIDMN